MKKKTQKIWLIYAIFPTARPNVLKFWIKIDFDRYCFMKRYKREVTNEHTFSSLKISIFDYQVTETRKVKVLLRF